MTEEEQEQSEPQVYEAAEVFVFETPFSLRGEDFLRLTKIPSYFPIWAHTLTSGAFLYFLKLGADHWVSVRTESQSPVSEADWWFAGFLAVFVVVLQIVNFFLPSERKETISRIKKHFDEQKEGRTMVKRQK
jgi:H+/Cl- antiporter ClcA